MVLKVSLEQDPGGFSEMPPLLQEHWSCWRSALLAPSLTESPQTSQNDAQLFGLLGTIQIPQPSRGEAGWG